MIVLAAFIALVGPNGADIYVAQDQVVAVMRQAGGACPTAVVTMSGTFYVCEPLEAVKKKLEAK